MHTDTGTATPPGEDRPHGIFLDVHPHLDADFTTRVAEQVETAVETALRRITFGLSLTEDERLTVEMYRAQRESKAVDNEINRRSAHNRIAQSLHARDADHLD